MKDPIHNGYQTKPLRDVHLLFYRGGSMWPLLRKHDRLAVCHIDYKDIQAGDIIVFQLSAEKGNIVHRVLTLSPQGIITKGDNNPDRDQEAVKPEQIAGKVIRVQRSGRWYSLQNLPQPSKISSTWRAGMMRLVKTGLLAARPLRPIITWQIARWGKLTSYTRSQTQMEYHLHFMGVFLGKYIKGQWHIRPVFQPLINTAQLPSSFSGQVSEHSFETAQ